MRYIVIVLSLAACQPNVFHGVTTVTAQEGETLNTVQNCILGERAVILFDIAYTLTIFELNKEGLLSLSDPRIEESFDKLQVCLVEQPEACPPNGPFAEVNGTVFWARKRGCAYSSSVRVSVYWPPICSNIWPDEPHCIPSGEQSGFFYSDFAHEVVNMCAIRYFDYTKKQGKIYEPEGVNSRVKEKFLKILGFSEI